MHSYEELQYVWEEWRANSGALMIDSFLPYLDLENEAADLNGLNDASEMWLQAYTLDMGGDDEQFRADLEETWQDVRPLYVKLHHYLR